LNLGDLVPPAFERYRPAIVDGLTFFLENLAPERAVPILLAQAAMPEDASIDARIVGIARHCPALHKLGQVLARDRRLPAEFRRHLQHLEMLPATQPLAVLQVMLESEIGPLAERGLVLDEPPIAEASVATVVPFRWHHAVGEPPRRGVFKILKPGVVDHLGEELWLLQQVGALLDERCHHYGIPEIAYEESLSQVRALLALEVHLDREQDHLVAARRNYASMPSIAIPELFPFSTASVTAMERIDGCKVTDVDQLTPEQQEQLASTVVDALVAHPIWSGHSPAMYHADPHAGNLMLTNDGRLGILDWSLVGYLKKRDQILLTQILLGALTFDSGRISAAISELAVEPADDTLIQRIVETNVAKLGASAWPGLGWLEALMDDAVTLGRMRFGADLLVFRKVLLTLKGVLADVSGTFRVDNVLIRAFFQRFAADWEQRLIAAPDWRGFATHLSNMDVAHALVSAPLTATRLWLGANRTISQEISRWFDDPNRNSASV
jgi:ubiquinone biosynthesis protein